MSSKNIKARLEDCGKGLSVAEGDIVYEAVTGEYYEVVSVERGIHTHQSGSGRGNYILATVRPADPVEDDDELTDVDVYLDVAS